MRKIKRLQRSRALLAAISLACLTSAHGQQDLKTVSVEIKHIGPPAASEPLIRANIRVKEGENFRREAVDEDIRNLYKTGYFYNIRVAEDRTPQGVKLTYVLQGKPLLTEIRFKGNKKYSDSKLTKNLTSKVGQPLDERKLFEDAQAIQVRYEKAGYQKTIVKPSVVPDENAGRATVTFEVQEAIKVQIKDVIFDGAQAFSQRKLRKQMKTRRHWMFSWLTSGGRFKEDQFEEDKEKLIEFYQGEGYIDFEIKEVKFDYVTPDRMILRLVIFEGNRYKVGAVNFKGNTLFTTNELVGGISYLARKDALLPGKTFSPKSLSKTVDAVGDFYGAKGYVDTRVVAVKVPNTTSGMMDLTFQITEGDKSFIERIDIRGNTKTRDKVIRRELAVSPGEVYNTVLVKVSKERLEQMQFFEERIDARPEDTDVPNRKNVVIIVEEKNTGSVVLGAGASSVDQVFGYVEMTQGNFDLFHPPTFTGGGQKLRLRAQVGTQRQDYLASFIEPWFLNQRLALGVDLYHRDLQYLSDFYDQTQTGGSISLTKALSQSLSIRGTYTLESIGVHLHDGYHTNTIRVPTTTTITPTKTNTNFGFTNAPNISNELFEERGTRLVSKIGLTLAYDTRNSYLLPNRGQRSELIGEFAGGPLGGETDFIKWEAKTSWYFPGFFEGHVFEVGAKTGVVDSYGRSSRVPIFDRWFLGGAYSLRGYKYRKVGDVGTIDFLGEPVGGNTYVFGTAEYSLPIIEKLRFALFYDIGNVYKDAYDYSHLSNYNDNFGFGIRLNLPIGPLRFDYGIPRHHDPRLGGSSGRFNFTAGYTREF